jgi:drug/metabolite transporter (DMT)-like permease
MKHPPVLAYVAFAIICVVWGTTYLAIRFAVQTVPPFLLTGIRYTIAGTIMLVIARARGERVQLTRSMLLNLAAAGIFTVGLGNLAVVWAEQWVPSGMAALLVATAPFWMAILELFRGEGERLDLRMALGMLVGFAGVALLVMPHGGAHGIDRTLLVGALVIQVGSLGWQLGSMRSKYYVKKVPLLTSASLQMLIGGLTVDIIGLAIGEAPRLYFTRTSALALAYLTIFGSLIAYSAYVYMLQHLRTTQSSIYAYINPVIAVIAGWLFAGERLTWFSALAMVVILGGVALVQTGGKQKPAPVAETCPVEEKSAA